MGFVNRSDRDLLGPNNQQIPKLVAVFAEVCESPVDTTKLILNLEARLFEIVHYNYPYIPFSFYRFHCEIVKCSRSV